MGQREIFLKFSENQRSSKFLTVSFQSSEDFHKQSHTQLTMKIAKCFALFVHCSIYVVMQGKFE